MRRTYPWQRRLRATAVAVLAVIALIAFAFYANYAWHQGGIEAQMAELRAAGCGAVPSRTRAGSGRQPRSMARW